MSRPRFLADHDLKDSIVDGVTRREPLVEFTPIRELGLAGKSDPEVLEYAAGEGLIIVSHDVNSMSAHAYARVRAGLPMSGLFLVKQTEPNAPVIESLLVIWDASEAEEWADKVTYLPL